MAMAFTLSGSVPATSDIRGQNVRARDCVHVRFRTVVDRPTTMTPAVVTSSNSSMTSAFAAVVVVVGNMLLLLRLMISLLNCNVCCYGSCLIQIRAKICAFTAPVLLHLV